MSQQNIQKIVTKDSNEVENGWIMPLFKKDDPFFNGYELQFVYASAINPGHTKGPHLHKKRECRLVCIQGDIELIVREDGEYKKYVLSSSEPAIIVVKAGDPFMVRCSESAVKEGILLNFANHMWKSDDQDNYKPNEWDYRE